MALRSDIPLKPCPFCGSSEVKLIKYEELDSENNEYWIWAVFCYRCSSEWRCLGNNVRDDITAEKWNRRADVRYLSVVREYLQADYDTLWKQRKLIKSMINHIDEMVKEDVANKE